VALEARHFLPDTHEEISMQETQAPDQTGNALRRWLEPRTIVIGVFVLAFAFTEGAGNDWIGVAVIDGYHAPAVLGTLAFAVFLAGMTGARWFGPSLLDRYGRAATVRSLAGVAIVGLLLFVFGQILALAFLGVLLWGVGASLGFPTGMSAAADEPTAAAGRVSVVASIGYLAFLGGPPFVGFLGNQFTVLHALTAIAIVLVISMLLAGALQPRQSVADQPPALTGTCD
jgi:MFS family permease